MYNLHADGNVEIRDKTEVHAMRARDVSDPDERARLRVAAVAAFPPYEEYQGRTSRTIPCVRRGTGLVGNLLDTDRAGSKEFESYHRRRK